jgi:hypothetical protein
MPDLAAVGFDLAFEDFPLELGGISFHIKKTGRYFQNGAEHQIRIPYDSAPRRWCLDLKDLRQPIWSAWQVAFTPDELLSMSWEVKLQGATSSTRGAFSLRNLRLYRNGGVGVAGSRRQLGLVATHRGPGVLRLERRDGQGAATALVVDLRGRTLARVDFAPGQRLATATGIPSGPAWIRFSDLRGSQTLALGL